MAPVLERYEGSFAHDVEVAHVCASSASPRTNRVFALAFPDPSRRVRFLDDLEYRAVRAALFEPAVANATELSASA